MKTKRGDPFVTTKRLGDVRLGIMRGGIGYVLDQISIGELAGMRKETIGVVGFPSIWVQTPDGVIVWPTPDGDYEVVFL